MDTTLNLAKYRMNSWKEIEAYLLHPEADNFRAYLNKIYGALMAMRPKDEISILTEVAPENREKFIKIGCLFITEGNSDYIYSDDYTVIKRLSEKPEKSIAEFLEKIALKKNRRNNELDKAEGTNNKAA